MAEMKGHAGIGFQRCAACGAPMRHKYDDICRGCKNAAHSRKAEYAHLLPRTLLAQDRNVVPSPVGDWAPHPYYAEFMEKRRGKPL